ncbi:MAG: helix-turn-helix transcriptional regulator [Bacilli bacterium]|nr:helix-turn-helix transcriptional regulator [Bacilli bacterium]
MKNEKELIEKEKKELSKKQLELLAKKKNLNNIFSKRFKGLVIEAKEKAKLKGEKLLERDIAKAIGVSDPALNSYYAKTPEHLQLIKISKYFGVSLEYLLGTSDNKYFVDYSLGKEYGLEDKAIANLKRIHNYATEWGYDESRPNIVLFAVNQLLGCDLKILYLIGDYLSYTSKDNPYLSTTTKEYLNDETLYVPNLELYNFKIAKAFEKIASDIRNSEEVAKMTNAKANKIEMKLFEQSQHDFEEYYSEEMEQAIKAANSMYE